MYVQHLQPVGAVPEEDRVIRPPDPTPATATAPGQWWPPVMLRPDWIAEHAIEIDVLHVHFGFESYTPAELSQTVEILARHHVPLVLTVHDLHNPHAADNTDHLARLDVLIPAAVEVITVTPGAARAIADRWGVAVTVVPHPHVVPLEELGVERDTRDRAGRFVVGLHAKHLRANIDPLPVARVLRDIVMRRGDAVLRVDLDDAVTDPDSHWYAPDVVDELRRMARDECVELRVHPRFDDDALWRYLREIDVSVLPYRFGTHSGWLEACHDVGTPVIAPRCGFYDEQRRCATYGFDGDGVDAASMDAALAAVIAGAGDPSVAATADRLRERDEVARAHHAIYRRALVGAR
ncbi:glycosyltransferase family protein [Williamsia deligens]|uniref:Glycosyltransferase family 1 protein n=1 Tax=Williamsia deligens TaxID=321325 RepID=A0ABW3G9N9_9NOCA|nr:glycosyltransferase family 1 protein [Williamsia deligens]MCP2192867.1 Glycosyltransferase involved in cell wall bisynthesis [Williamsia deligens]